MILFFIFTTGVVFSGQHYLTLSNTMKYKDQVDVYFSDDYFDFMIGYGFDRSDIEDTISGAGLNWLSLEVMVDRFSLNIGNEYMGYFSGMFLSLNKDESIGRDSRFFGIVFKEEGLLSSDLFIGEMRSGTYNDTGPFVAGGVISFSKGVINSGIGYSRFLVIDDSFPGAPSREHYTLFNSFSKGGNEIGVELFLLRNLGKFDPVDGWVKDEYYGRGGYLYSNLSFNPFFFTLEIKDYKDIYSYYTTPVPCTPDGESINQGQKERGGMVGVGISKGVFETTLKSARIISEQSHLDEIQSKTKFYITDDITLDVEGFYKYRELPFRVERKINLDFETFSISISPSLAFITEPLWDSLSFYETSLELGYNRLPFIFTLLIDKSFSQYYKDDIFYRGTVYFREDNFEISLSYGKTRTFLECGSGVCRWVPGFNGFSFFLYLRI